MNIKRRVNIDDVKSIISVHRDTGKVRTDVKWLISKEGGSTLSAFGISRVKPNPAGIGKRPLMHLHPAAEEIMYILSGRGLAFRGDEQFEFGPGDALFVPIGESHGSVNLSETEDIVMVFCYGGACDAESAGYQIVE